MFFGYQKAFPFLYEDPPTSDSKSFKLHFFFPGGGNTCVCFSRRVEVRGQPSPVSCLPPSCVPGIELRASGLAEMPLPLDVPNTI